jgi:hypothetical protein
MRILPLVSTENTIFCYVKLSQRSSRQMEENHPIW